MTSLAIHHFALIAHNYLNLHFLKLLVILIRHQIRHQSQVLNH